MAHRPTLPMFHMIGLSDGSFTLPLLAIGPLHYIFLGASKSQEEADASIFRTAMKLRYHCFS